MNAIIKGYDNVAKKLLKAGAETQYVLSSLDDTHAERLRNLIKEIKQETGEAVKEAVPYLPPGIPEVTVEMVYPKTMLKAREKASEGLIKAISSFLENQPSS